MEAPTGLNVPELNTTTGSERRMTIVEQEKNAP